MTFFFIASRSPLMAGCLGIGTVSFGRCTQPTTSRRNRQVFQKFLYYVDTPDLDINTLVRQVRKVLKGKDSVGLRFPQWIGLILGYAADGFTSLTGKNCH
jgi:hypothetical protein